MLGRLAPCARGHARRVAASAGSAVRRLRPVLAAALLALPLFAGLTSGASAQTAVQCTSANGDGSYSVPSDWALKPSGLNDGDRLRLLFITSTGALPRRPISGPTTRSCRPAPRPVTVRSPTVAGTSSGWVYVTFVRLHDYAQARRSRKSSKRWLSTAQRSAMMALAPATLQRMPPRLRRVPMMCLQPPSTTPVATHRPIARNFG